jgi:hypothetical protein
MVIDTSRLVFTGVNVSVRPVLAKAAAFMLISVVPVAECTIVVGIVVVSVPWQSVDDSTFVVVLNDNAVLLQLDPVGPVTPAPVGPVAP